MLNAFHLTIKFREKWSKGETFFTCQCRLRIRHLETDEHIKPTDTHQFLESTYCQPYYCNKIIPYYQALKYNRTCSDNENLDQCCDNLEKWLIKRGYSERMLRIQMLKARGESRDGPLEQENTRTS